MFHDDEVMSRTTFMMPEIPSLLAPRCPGTGDSEIETGYEFASFERAGARALSRGRGTPKTQPPDHGKQLINDAELG